MLKVLKSMLGFPIRGVSAAGITEERKRAALRRFDWFLPPLSRGVGRASDLGHRDGSDPNSGVGNFPRAPAAYGESKMVRSEPLSRMEGGR